MKEAYFVLLLLFCIGLRSSGLRILRAHSRETVVGRLWSTHEVQVLVADSTEGETDAPSIPMFLPSQRSIDYVPLATMLATGDFKGADQFTRDNLIKLAGDEAVARNFVYWTDVTGMPSVDLATMERLWLQFSGGKFGFSVQKRIWAAEGGNFDRFIRRIGWTTAEPTQTARPSSIASGESAFGGVLGSVNSNAALLVQDELSATPVTSGTERLRKWFGNSEFIYEVDRAPLGHLPLTNAIRGTQLIRQLLMHPVWDQYDWKNHTSMVWQ